MLTATWLAVAFSVCAGIFWLFSTCCCSGKSDKKSVKVEKAPYTYERVASPYLGQSANQGASGSGVRMQDLGPGKQTVGYEPYRHA